MPRKLFVFLFAAVLLKTAYAQNIPVINAASNKADVREDGKLTKDAWVISPKEKMDVYPTSGKSVTFYTDIALLTISFQTIKAAIANPVTSLRTE